MILAKDTNIVYLSSLLRQKPEYSKACARLAAVLDRHGINLKFLESTNDIWCRDYMPIQIDPDNFVQFRYHPRYLKGFDELRSDPVQVLNDNGLKADHSNINLDGGNLVSWLDRAIVSDRIFDENREYPNKSTLINELERELSIEIIVIPQIKSDMTGHADGLVRFINRSTLIGNQRDKEFAYWQKKMERVLRDHNLDYIDIPFFYEHNKRHPESAIGCYINFLEVSNLVLLPSFGRDDMDATTSDLFGTLYPDRVVDVININEIGVHGGLLNCITWAVKD